MARKAKATTGAPPAQPLLDTQTAAESTRMNTRAKNKKAHPGLPDLPGWNPDTPEQIPLLPAERRAELAIARKEDAAKAALQRAVQSAAIVKAAAIEDRQRDKDRAAEQARRQPVRPRPRPVQVAPGAFLTFSKRPLRHPAEERASAELASPPGPGEAAGGLEPAGPNETANGEPDLARVSPDVEPDDEGSQAESAAYIVESGQSGSEFDPSLDDEDAVESDESSDEDKMDEETEEQPVKGKGKGRMKVRRADVSAAHSHVAAAATVPKRKIVTSGVTNETPKASKKVKVAATPVGLRAGWNTPKGTPTVAGVGAGSKSTPRPLVRRYFPPNGAGNVPAIQASQSSGPGLNNTAGEQPNGDGVAPGADAAPAGVNDYGGLPDEDDAPEAAVVPHAPAAPWPGHPDSSDSSSDDEPNGPVDPLTDVVHVPANVAAGLDNNGQGTGTRRRWTTGDLDVAIRQRFTQAFIPLARATMSSMPPWYSLTLEERQGLYDMVFPGHGHLIAANDIVYSLMNGRVSEWQGKFALAALVTIENHFVKNNMAEPEARATFCQAQLGTSVAAMKAPFMWKVWENGRKKGRFQGSLIVKTLGIVNVPVFESVPLDLRDAVDDYPTGALVLATLAVERALRIWSTGERVIPRGHAGHFSADNWGDRTTIVQGVARTGTKVSGLYTSAQAISPARWLTILDAAREHHRRHRIIQEQQAIVIASGDEEALTDSDLESE